MQLIDPDTAAAIGERVIREVLDDFEGERARRQPMNELKAEAMLESRLHLKSGYQESLAFGDWQGFHHTVDAFISEHGLDVKRHSLTYWELCRLVVMAAVDGERIAESRLTNDIATERTVLNKYRREVMRPVTTEMSQQEQPQKPPDKNKERKEKRFGDHLDEFARDKLELGHWGESTASQQTGRNRRFVDLVGNVALDEIVPMTVRDYRSQLGCLPTHMNKRKAYRDKSAAELVDMEIPDEVLIEPRTVGEYLDALSSYLSWCVEMGYASSNPARDIKKPKYKHKPRVPFDNDDLQSLLLNSDMTQGRMGYSWRHWAPLIALFSGTRASEIAQLRIADVRGREDGHPFLSINDEDNKKVKTDSACREIPVHSELISLGFLDYVAAIENAGHSRLFPKLTVPSDRPHRNLSRWFAEYRLTQGIGGPDDDNKQFHSFRSTARTTMGQADVQKQHIDDVIGHSAQTTGERYYQYGYTFEQRQRAIEAIRFEALDFSSLYDVWRQYV